MDRPIRVRRLPSRAWGAGIAVACLLLTVLVPVASAAPVRLELSVAESGSHINGEVTWEGRNTANAPSPSSAFGASLSGSFDLVYTWDSVASVGASANTLPLYTISDARLVMLYFGASLSTRDIIESNALPATSGRIFMNWTPPSILHDLVAGTFELSASLLAPNGTTYWSENFYIDATAPYTVGAVIPALLLLIAVYEVYALATSGRQALTKLQKPPASTDGKESTDSGAEPEGSTSPPKDGEGGP